MNLPVISGRLPAFVAVLALAAAAPPVFGQGAPGNDVAQVAPPSATEEEGFTNPFEAVEVQTLSQLDTGLVGLIGEENGGLAPTAWAGTERLVAELILPRLPSQTGSPVLSDLQRRLLLSRTAPPSGATVAGAGFFASRLARVAAMGQVGAVEPLAQQAGGNAGSPPVLAARVDALLLQGRDSDACDMADQARGHASSTDWVKRFAFCDGVAGNVTGARLGVDLLRETGEGDEAFAVLMARLVDNAKAEPDRFSDFSAVHFALLRRTGANFPPAAITRAGGGFVTALAALETLPVDTRIEAAERAIAAGAVPTGALKSLYVLAIFDEAQLGAAAPGTELPKGPLGAALAYQKFQATQAPAEAGFYLAHILRDSRSRGVAAPVARALRTELAALPALPELSLYALDLGIGEVLAGDPVVARRWLDLLAADSSGAKGELQALLAVAGDPQSVGWTADTAAKHIEAAAGADKEKAILVYSLSRALGGPSSANAYYASLAGDLLTFGPVPNSAPLEGLITASSKTRTAETLMFALAIMGDNGVGSAHPATLVSVIGALRRAGFESEARALAAEVVAAQIR